MWYALLATLPWILLGLHMAFRIREPTELPPAEVPEPDGTGPGLRRHPPEHAEPPLVSVVVPARNEARNIVACLETLAAQHHPAFEILVVDDRSRDGTGELARSVAHGRARELRVVPGEPLPDGWFGKPWACHQGSRAARGELLLFTDADTRHAPDLMARCVAGILEDGVAALSPVGRQEMDGFGERLVQPHMFALLGLRYPFLDRPVEPGSWRDAILSGQYTLIWREAYDSIGGHEAVKGEVVEDLRLGQELVRAGHRISIRGAGDGLSTRMYHSLRELVEGWSKNVATGAEQAAGRLGPVAVPAMVAFILVAWILPPLVLAGAVVGALPGPPLPSLDRTWGALGAWAAAATGVSAAIWAGVYVRFGAPVRFAFLYPLGAAVVAFIGLRSWLRGSRRIEWKDRTYAGGKVVGREER